MLAGFAVVVDFFASGFADFTLLVFAGFAGSFGSCLLATGFALEFSAELFFGFSAGLLIGFT